MILLRWTRKPRAQALAGLGLSLLAHLALLLALALPRLGSLPRLPIEVQIIPSRAKPVVPPLQATLRAAAPQPGTGDAPRQKPKKPQRPPRPAKPRQDDRPGPAAPDKPVAPTTPGGLAADDASVAVMLRMAALRTSPHRPSIEAFLDAFPDARLVAAGTDLQTPRALSSFLLDRIDGLLITTADVRLLSATVLIAVHDPGLDLRQRLSARTGAPLIDPRQLVQAEPGLTVYAREDLLRGWLLDGQGRLNQGLAAKLRAFTREQDSAVVAELRHLDRLVRVGGLPTPTQLVLSLSAQARPAVRLRLEFSREADAQQVGGAWPALQERLAGQLVWLGLGGLFGDLRVAIKDSTVEVTGSLSSDDVDLLLGMLVALLPPVAPAIPPVTTVRGSRTAPNPDLGPPAEAAPRSMPASDAALSPLPLDDR